MYATEAELELSIRSNTGKFPKAAASSGATKGKRGNVRPWQPLAPLVAFVMANCVHLSVGMNTAMVLVLT